MPPFTSGTATLRVRVWFPPLQGRLHLPQEDQSENWQFTGVVVIVLVALVVVALRVVEDVWVSVLG